MCANLRPTGWLDPTYSLITDAAKFIYDSLLLATSSQPLAKKYSIWRTYARLSLPVPMNDHQVDVAGFTVSYFDRATLEFLYREIFVRQCYRLRPLGAEPVIFDCGANLGMATLFFKFLCPLCRIKCFEPDPATFSLLDRNIHDNSLDRVEPFNVALWNEDCIIDFFSSGADPGSLLMSTNAARMKAPSIPVEG